MKRELGLFERAALEIDRDVAFNKSLSIEIFDIGTPDGIGCVPRGLMVGRGSAVCSLEPVTDVDANIAFVSQLVREKLLLSAWEKARKFGGRGRGKGRLRKLIEDTMRRLRAGATASDV